MEDFEDRVIDKLDKLADVTTTTKTKVGMLQDQSEKQFDLIRETSTQVTINTTEIGNLKQHRNGKNWLGKALIRFFLGSV